MLSNAMVHSTRDIPTGALGVGVPLLLFFLLMAGLVASYTRASGAEMSAKPGAVQVWDSDGAI